MKARLILGMMWLIFAALGCTQKSAPQPSSPTPTVAPQEQASAESAEPAISTLQTTAYEPYFVYVRATADESLKAQIANLAQDGSPQQTSASDESGTRYTLRLTSSHAQELQAQGGNSVLLIPIHAVQARVTIEIGKSPALVLVRQMKNVLPLNDVNLNDPWSYLFEARICQQVDSQCIRYLAERGVFSEALINQLKRDQWGVEISRRNAEQRERFKIRLLQSLARIDAQLKDGVEKLTAPSTEIIQDVSLKFSAFKVRWSKNENVGLPIPSELVVNAGTVTLDRAAFIYNLGSDWAADLPPIEVATLAAPKTEISLSAVRELNQALLEALR